MTCTRDIRTKINSIQNTQKITKAMEMLAIAKMRKNKLNMLAHSPYAQMIHKIVSHLLCARLEYKHPYLLDRESIMRVGCIVISSDRGLVGSLNTNLFRHILTNIKIWEKNNMDVHFALIGYKSVLFFSGIGVKIIAQITGIGDKPQLEDIIGIVNVMLKEYDKNNINRLYIANNKFINTMSQSPQLRQLLPIAINNENVNKSNKFGDYLYEPDSKSIVDMLLQRYIESQVYNSVIENMVSEQAARMITMRSASDNGGEMIKELQLTYNRMRQSNITQELTEIISGSSVF
ncbi:F0F1 ATP synthase subunit gamma [Candidatus Schneideria nysicola]|uniref:F0F1 ATP synthase subunit gamma n=1 Tax=Candidatus Schneideria nysicola TaxID=1081631 RepID=UPI001CAA5E2E|nr:F0F1 ATP synthase subunit gamma [Candidatus Schneideria nysicola]UAJ65269.1 F0F1 ATP synthase subunit gamma [Candidatus Schneideria nysicola]